ncbi:MAG: hypothetical protein E7678_07300 [Ruminococcaceae bacterium]|nr:hypothetical protein [Oscillospiraceae bacterium]
MAKKDIINTVILIACLVLVFFGVLIYTVSPELRDFRNSVYGTIVACSFICGIILYLTLTKRIDMPGSGKVTVWGFAFLYILCVIFDFGRIEMLFFLIYSVVNVLVAIYIYKTSGKVYSSIWSFGALAYLFSVIIGMDVKYINGEMNATFLIVSIVFAVLAFIPCLIYAIKRYAYEMSKENLISIPLVGLLGGFLITYLVVSSMNVYLDSSTPTHEEYVIVDKKVRAGAKQITKYEFEVQNDDSSFFIGVSEESFHDHEINDKITLSIYNGAFNEPYYIYENKED